LLRTRDLEIEYHKAKFERQRKAQEAESSKSHQLTKQVSTFSQTESELRTQLNIYVEKFKQVRPFHDKECCSSQWYLCDTDSIVQVEETLNNSNDLFLTFRKEMEEMSRKTKRLERENNQLTRAKADYVSNAMKAHDECESLKAEVVKLQKKNDNLEKLCRGMQAQGRGQVNSASFERGEEDGSNSEYDDYGDDEEISDGFGEDTEEEVLATMHPGPKTFGPPLPPEMIQQQVIPGAKTNGTIGKHQVNGQINGVKH
jgi:DNA repair exonuclease SbcCD ATPase subunit